jgi:GTP cyclohydrolase II
MRAAQTGALLRVASTRMPTKWGMFDAIGFERDVSNRIGPVETAFAIVMGELTEGAPMLRIYSQYFTGEVLGSLRCDCHDQLEMAMQAIAEPHSFPYLRAKKEKMGQALSLSTVRAPTGQQICVRCDLVAWRATCTACAADITTEAVHVAGRPRGFEAQL